MFLKFDNNGLRGSQSVEVVRGDEYTVGKEVEFSRNLASNTMIPHSKDLYREPWQRKL